MLKRKNSYRQYFIPITNNVIPAKAGIQVVNKLLKKVWDLDPGLRRDDGSRKLFKLQFVFLTLLITSLSISTVNAEFFVGPGATGASFLKIPVAARATAMGNSFTAVSGDITAIEYNPAGLGGINKRDINVTFIDYLKDTSLQSVAFGFPVQTIPPPKKGSISKPPKKFNLGVQYRVFQADDERRSNVGVKQGEFDIRDQLFHLAGALRFTPRLVLGIGGKLINSKLQDESATSYAGDAGFIWQPADRLSIGGSILNVGPKLKFIDEGDPLPTTAKLGVGLKSNRFLLLGDASVGRDEIIQGSGGFEWSLNQFVALRGGVLFLTSIEVTGGLGVRFGSSNSQPRATFSRDENKKNLRLGSSRGKKQGIKPQFEFGLDYAIQTRNDLGISNTITLKILY